MQLQYQLYNALLLFPSVTSAVLYCRPEGPVLPKPSNINSSPTFQDATASLAKTLDSAVAGEITAGWHVKNVSFSMAVVSLDQEDPGVPIWEYHHLSENNVDGTKHIGRDSQYLIGSISKVISDYILLKSGVNIDAPITEFLPKLADGKSRIRWEDVTLRMLASHLGGVPPNYGFSEWYFLKDAFTAYGFPKIDDSEYPPCGVIALNKPCSQKDFMDGMLHAYPVTAPMERPAYSNIAFSIFAMALEEVTGKNYTQLVREVVSESLGMRSTRPSPGDDDKAVIPPGDSSWGVDYGREAPGGGLVSSIADLSRFTYGLLSRSLDLTPTQIRQWLKPDSFSGGAYSAVGMPWEIFRPVDLVPNHPHTITIFGKGGGAQLYRSQLSVVDEYGIGLVVLTAGPMDAQMLLTDAVIATIVPAVDAVSREQAEKGYERTFKARCDKSDENGCSVDVTFKQDVDSLVISSFTRNGSDIASAIGKIWNMTMGQFSVPIGPTVRLFPTDLTADAKLNGKDVKGEVWRLWPEFVAGGKSDLPGAGLEEKNCLAWTVGDWIHYGREPMDRVLFYRDDQGEVVGFEAPFLRSGILEAV